MEMRYQLRNQQISKNIHQKTINDRLKERAYLIAPPKIGQYLLTLPQHLESFLFRDNPSLTCALKCVDQEYATAPEVEGALADVFLRMVVRGTCQSFCDQILSICQLSQPAARQLSHDIGYLNNVLQDLGISLSENLQQLQTLLKIPADQYQQQSTGYSARYVAAVRQMRNITLN